MNNNYIIFKVLSITRRFLNETNPNMSKGYMYRKQLFEEYSGKVI